MTWTAIAEREIRRHRHDSVYAMLLLLVIVTVVAALAGKGW